MPTRDIQNMKKLRWNAGYGMALIYQFKIYKSIPITKHKDIPGMLLPS